MFQSDSLSYYFPIQHPKNNRLDDYKGKFSQQPDFLLFKEKLSCESSDYQNSSK